METEKTGRTCQSCGMPITKGADFGTDADGRKFLEYCRFCFKGGKFTDD
ncbi:zinc ribbon domain-containing protein, partial [Candidatus Micrarchaeota archaeon]|nr:zinc ribbon domain-containing protein [Candidatus Micrarchaeota archaeon]MBU1939739.1 zinc ribbon domain-containing protein [Candidatus Micrarchaeota archaeon]